MAFARWLEIIFVSDNKNPNELDMAIGMPGKKGVISGMRGSCEVVVEINMVKAIKQGKIPFYISENQVILSGGVGEKGYLPPEYFRQVLNIKANEIIYSAPFDYIVVFDFECQCEDKTKNLTFNVRLIISSITFIQEIIEFPVVVIDVKQKKIVGEF